MSSPDRADEIVKRLTDPKNFTGSHKQRFDENGKGRGREGRVDIVKNDGYVNGFKKPSTPNKEDAADEIVKRLTDPKKFTGSHKQRFDENGKGKGREGRVDIVKNDGYVNGFKKEKSSSGSQEDIVKRLTDPKNFTGSHKQRFDENGKGKGREGRVDIVKNDGYVNGFKKEKNPSSSDSQDAIVKRLTDPKNFTGMYKKRFEEDTEEKAIKDLSEITRTELRNSPAKKPSTPNSRPTSRSSTPKKSADGSVFDRLTDPKKFTGTQKHKLQQSASSEESVAPNEEITADGSEEY